MKICSGGYARHGIVEGTFSHTPIVFEEDASLGVCPLCMEKVLHETTYRHLHGAQDDIAELIAILQDHDMAHLIPKRRNFV